VETLREVLKIALVESGVEVEELVGV